MTAALIIFYIIIAIALIILVLLQDPKGGSGGIFGGGGGGGGNSLFGATGATSFIVRATRWIAVLFAVCVVGLNFTLMSGGSNSATESAPEIQAPKLIDDEPKAENKDENPAAAAVESVDSSAESAQNNKGEEQ